MNRLRLAAFAAALLASSPGFAETGKFERSYPFVGDKDIKVGIKFGDVTIDSVPHPPLAGLGRLQQGREGPERHAHDGGGVSLLEPGP